MERRRHSDDAVEPRLPLFAGPPVDPVVALIDRNLAIWENVRRRAETDPGLGSQRETLARLERDLRSLRDFSLATTHPKIRHELLREAAAITRRMKSIGSRLRVRGLDVLPSSAVH